MSTWAYFRILYRLHRYDRNPIVAAIYAAREALQPVPF